jgi:hypothetical protein
MASIAAIRRKPACLSDAEVLDNRGATPKADGVMTAEDARYRDAL